MEKNILIILGVFFAVLGSLGFIFSGEPSPLSLYCIDAVIFGFICLAVGKDRNISTNSAFAWGYFLGIIGLIVVITKERKSDIAFKAKTLQAADNNKIDNLLKLAELKEKGLLTDEEFEKFKAMQ